MRTLVLLGILAMARSAQAQGYPEEMVISLSEVEARSGPTKKYYPTSILKSGDRVLVLRQSEQEPGWLAIKPPQGSFSWINAKSIKQIDARTAVVVTEGGVTILCGSALADKRPDVQSAKIPQGSIVTILDKGKSADGETWLPILPWPTEARFIPGEAVQTRQFAATNNAASKVAALPSRLASPSQSPWSPAQTPGHPQQMAQSTSWAVGQTASFSQTNPAQQKLAYPPQWSQVGTLRRAAFDTAGQPTYVLEDSRGRVLMYATCLPGMTLRDYVGRTVALYGSVSYRSDDYLRTHLMTASYVATY